MSEWQHFKLKEFTCKCGCEGNEMDHAFITWLDELRHWYGHPMVITSGYRCPAHNNAVSSTGFDGPHTTGKAADIAVARDQARAVIKLADNMDPRVRGLGVNQKGGGRFLHLDLCDRPKLTIWSY